MYHLTTWWTVAIVATSLAVLSPGCSLEPTPQRTGEPIVLDELEYDLELEGARRLAGSDTIPRRSGSYGLEAKELPRIHFEERDTDWARSMLWRGGEAMFGRRISSAEEIVDDQLAALRLDGAVAWVDIRSGACSFKRHDGVRGITKVADAREAVDLSLEQLAGLDLLDLAEGVTLDVVSVTSTHYAAWYREEDVLKPVGFGVSPREETRARFKSGYTVYFGRRFEGVPVVGPALMARLDADGMLVALTKSWRDIGRTDPRIDAVEEPLELPAFTYQACGYLEGPGIAYRQESPGIGCIYSFVDDRAGEPLASTTSTTVSFSGDLDPLGEPLFD